jgi:hypothetical protein
MDKEVSIVRVDTRNHRSIARNNWGLTKKQMKGMHVHHRIPVSEGGTNDPSNLYVCSPSMHTWGWHNGEQFIEWASEGGTRGAQKIHKVRLPDGRSVHGVHMANRSHLKKREDGKSEHAVNMGRKGSAKTHEAKNKEGKSINAIRVGHIVMAPKDENGKSIHAVKVGKITASKGVGCHAPEHKGKGAKTTNSQKWVDPDHPEIGTHSAPTLVSMQKRRGLPHGKENRLKVG